MWWDSLGREERMSDQSCFMSMRVEAWSIGASRYIHRPKGCSKLLVGKDGPVVIWVNTSIVLIPLFRIDVPTSSQHIGFRSKLTRAVLDC